MQRLKITVPKNTQADILLQIAKDNGLTRKALLRRLAIELANELPEVDFVNQKTVQIVITAFPEEAKNKIIRYCESIKSSPSSEFKRKIDDFIRHHQDQLVRLQAQQHPAPQE